jgi:cation diffusion facilitator CzcD-associated flavoprotein CzcO
MAIRLQVLMSTQEVWLSTPLISAEFDQSTQLWSAIVYRKGILVNLHVRHIILCGGRFAVPYMPEYRNRVRNIRLSFSSGSADQD